MANDGARLEIPDGPLGSLIAGMFCFPCMKGQLVGILLHQFGTSVVVCLDSKSYVNQYIIMDMQSLPTDGVKVLIYSMKR